MDKERESRNLLQATHDAWLKFENFTEEQVERILLEISKVGIANAEPLAKLVVEETERSGVPTQPNATTYQMTAVAVAALRRP